MTKEVKELFTRDDGLWYAKGAKKPFTGRHKLYHDNGLCTYYHDNGNKQVEGVYKNGDQEGIWSYYDENGKKLSKSMSLKMESLLSEMALK